MRLGRALRLGMLAVFATAFATANAISGQGLFSKLNAAKTEGRALIEDYEDVQLESTELKNTNPVKPVVVKKKDEVKAPVTGVKKDEEKKPATYDKDANGEQGGKRRRRRNRGRHGRGHPYKKRRPGRRNRPSVTVDDDDCEEADDDKRVAGPRGGRGRGYGRPRRYADDDDMVDDDDWGRPRGRGRRHGGGRRRRWADDDDTGDDDEAWEDAPKQGQKGKGQAKDKDEKKYGANKSEPLDEASENRPLPEQEEEEQQEAKSVLPKVELDDDELHWIEQPGGPIESGNVEFDEVAGGWRGESQAANPAADVFKGASSSEGLEEEVVPVYEQHEEDEWVIQLPEITGVAAEQAPEEIHEEPTEDVIYEEPTEENHEEGAEEAHADVAEDATEDATEEATEETTGDVAEEAHADVVEEATEEYHDEGAEEAVQWSSEDEVPFPSGELSMEGLESVAPEEHEETGEDWVWAEPEAEAEPEPEADAEPEPEAEAEPEPEAEAEPEVEASTGVDEAEPDNGWVFADEAGQEAGQGVWEDVGQEEWAPSEALEEGVGSEVQEEEASGSDYFEWTEEIDGDEAHEAESVALGEQDDEAAEHSVEGDGEWIDA